MEFNFTPEQLRTLDEMYGLQVTDVVAANSDEEYIFVTFLTESEPDDITSGRWIAAIRVDDGEIEEVIDEADTIA